MNCERKFPTSPERWCSLCFAQWIEPGATVTESEDEHGGKVYVFDDPADPLYRTLIDAAGRNINLPRFGPNGERL